MLNQPITLITAVPGGGKTLRALYEGIELAKAGREVFAFGIDGLNTEKIREIYGVEIIDVGENWSLDKWKELPSGSVLLVDEAHKFLPVRQPGKPPAWIQDLTEIRHFGIQLVLITQDPRNIDSFVRRLVGEHLHLTRKAGFSGAMVRTFQGVAENTDDFTARQSSTQAPWLYDKKLYDCYKSASLHVIKPKLPKKIIFALIAGLAIIITIPYVIFKFKGMFSDGEKDAVTQASTPKKQAFDNANEKNEIKPWDSTEEFVKAHTPLVPVAPWSAPIYKGLTPSTVPKIYCVASGLENHKDRTCRCYTEQVTKVENIPAFICEKIIKDGVYNPYLQPSTPSPTPTQSGASVDARSGGATIINSPDGVDGAVLQPRRGLNEAKPSGT